MANVVVSTTSSNINVAQTTSNISVTDTSSNVVVTNVTTAVANVTVSATTTNVNVSQTATVTDNAVRTKISVANISGFGNLAYNNAEGSNGVIQYTGVSQEDIRGQFSSEKIGTGYGNVQYVEANGAVQYTGVSNVEIKDTAFNDIKMMTFDDQFTLGQPTTGGWINYDQANGTLQYRPLHYNPVHFDNGTYGNLNNEISMNVTFLGNNFDTNFATKTTDDLTEGSTNLYFSTDLANSAIDNYTGSFANATINTTNTITTTANVAGANFIGDVVGNVTGDVTGDVVGNVTGTLSGNVLYPSNSNVFIDVTRGDIGGRDITARNVYLTGGNQGGVRTQQIASNALGYFPPSIGTDNSPTAGLYLAGTDGSSLEPVTIVGDVIRVGTSVDANVRVDSTSNTISMHADSGVSVTTDTNGNIDLTPGTGGFINANKPVYVNNLKPLTNGNIEVEGNLNVQGNLNYVNVEDLFVNDERIVLNYGNASSRDVFIIADRSGDSRDNVAVKWNNTSNVWQFTNDGTTFYNIPASTSDLAEGTNLYYTQSRFDTAFGNKSTTDLSEGTNLYFSNARVDSYIQDGEATLIKTSVDAEPVVLQENGLTVRQSSGSSGNSANVYSVPRISTFKGGPNTDWTAGTVTESTANTMISAINHDSARYRDFYYSPAIGGPGYVSQGVTNLPATAIVSTIGTPFNANGSFFSGFITSNASLMPGTIEFRTVQESVANTLIAAGDTIFYSNMTSTEDATVAYMDSQFHVGTKSSSYSFPKTPGGTNQVLQLDSNNDLQFVNAPGLNNTYANANVQNFLENGYTLANIDANQGIFTSVSGNGSGLTNLNGANISGAIDVTGSNITADYFIGNGSQLTNLALTGGYGITYTGGTGTIEVTNSEIQAQANIAIGNNTTDNLSEGATNLYYTTDRANSAIAAYTGTITNLTGNVTTTANMQANYFIATEEFIGDLEGAISEKGYNNTGSTLSKGDAVYVNGYQGDTPNIALANAESAAHMPAVGIVKENIGAGATGQFVTSGTMNFASHGFTAGDELFVNGAGTLVTAAPTGENQLIQKIGKALGPNHILVQGAGRTNATPNLNNGNIFLGNASNKAVTAVFTDEANTAIGAYTGDMLNVDDISANTLTTSNAVTSQSFVYVEQQSNTSVGGIRAFEGGTSFTNFNTNQPALNVENGFLAIQASDETSNVFSVPRYALGKLPDVPAVTTTTVDQYAVTGGTYDSATYAMPGGVEAPTGAMVSTVNKRRATNIPAFGGGYFSEGATPHSTGLIQYGTDDSNVLVVASQSFGDYAPGIPMYTIAPVANGTITFRTIQTDILSSIPSIAPYNEAVNFANSTVAYMDSKFNIGREDDGTSYNFPKTKGSAREYLRLGTGQDLEFVSAFAGTVNDQGTVLGNVTIDIATADIHKIETAGDITDFNITNAPIGTRLKIIVKQGSSTGALTGSTDFLWAGGSKTLSTNTGDIDIINITYDGTNYFAELDKGYVA